MAAYVLKLKTKAGSVVINGLNGKNTVSDLLKILTELTHVDASRTNVLRGFPPKPLNLSCSAASLEDIGLDSGETLIVEELSASPGSNGNPSTSSAPTPNRAGRTMESLRLRANADAAPQSVPGVVKKQIIPGDNSCLFTSVGFCLLGCVDQTCSTQLREMIATEVAAQPTHYSEAFLGRPNRDYCDWIQKLESWGGGIELSVLSKSFHIEMSVVNVVSSVISTFGEDMHYTRRVYLVFDGVHYDALYLEPFERGLPIQTVFSPDDAVILEAVHTFIQEAHMRREYTDLHGFSLVCGQCGTGLRGHQQASVHARLTGHTNFREITP